MRTITVEVTQADIDNGRRGHCSACPVARALRRVTRDEWHVGTTLLWRPRGDFDLKHPADVADFILRFDSRQPVAPFTFTLEVPE